MKINLDVLFKYLATRDKDTLIFGSIAALTIGALILKAPPIATIFAGALFVVLYIVMRYALLRIQMLEHERDVKSLPAKKARDVITQNATKNEQDALAKIAKAARTKRNRT